ncbi:DUF2089 family protein [Niabella terrae]
MPVNCPSCLHTLTVGQLKCTHCTTRITGDYQLPLYLQLSEAEQEFIMDFFLASGSIKEMARLAGHSYPTMRNKMDDMIAKIREMKTTGYEGQ